jgi:hypothetical protein
MGSPRGRWASNFDASHKSSRDRVVEVDSAVSRAAMMDLPVRRAG